MFELRGVSKHYAAQPALDALDLAFPAGAVTAVIGPSGCGKSTLLRALLGLTPIDAGEVRFDGQPLAVVGVQQVRRRVGYVIQGGGLFPHLTSRGNITLAARLLGWSRHRLDERVADLVRLTDLPTTCLDRFPGELSGGQAQRVALARALMLDPQVLLMDEPLSGLDPMIRHRLREDLTRIFQDLGKTVLWVTHDLAEAAWIADEVVLMRDGAVVERGAPAVLLDRPVDPFAQRFVRAQRELGRIGGESR